MNRIALGIFVAALALPAGSAWADGCAIGRRVSLEDGSRGAVVASAATAGNCIVELDNGTVATSSVERLSFDDATGGRPPVTTPPPVGVYVCTTPGLGRETTGTFNLIDAQNYTSSTGQRQAYRWDATSGVLELTRPDAESQRFRRTAEKAFRRIDGETLTDTGCVLEAARAG
jgi:hypothetical protein